MICANRYLYYTLAADHILETKWKWIIMQYWICDMSVLWGRSWCTHWHSIWNSWCNLPIPPLYTAGEVIGICYTPALHIIIPTSRHWRYYFESLIGIEVAHTILHNAILRRLACNTWWWHYTLVRGQASYCDKLTYMDPQQIAWRQIASLTSILLKVPLHSTPILINAILPMLGLTITHAQKAP